MVQAGVEIEIIRGLTELARAGTLVSSSRMLNASGNNASNALHSYKPNKVVHVGHSFGSFMTTGLLSRYGNLSDGAILTGFLINPHLVKEVSPAAFGYEFAPQSDPHRFADFSSGYIVSKTISNVQQLFLKKGTFEPELLTYAEKIKQPNTLGEIASTSLAFVLQTMEFTGPVQVSKHCYIYVYCDRVMFPPTVYLQIPKVHYCDMANTYWPDICRRI